MPEQFSSERRQSESDSLEGRSSQAGSKIYEVAPQPETAIQNVDVQKAENDFVELQTQLSNISKQYRRKSHGGTHHSSDVEKAIRNDDEEEPFDLEKTLRGQRQLEVETGLKGKEIGVIWNSLTVRGSGVANQSRLFVRTFPDSFTSLLKLPGHVMRLCGYGKEGADFDILREFRGLAHPGEMVLVLGKPSSGCTTFLKVISNQRFGYTKIDGSVLYGPFEAEEFRKRYRGEAVYNQEDDVHHETLTVGQTLEFGLDLKTPRKRPAGMSRADFKAQVIDLLLRMFNIKHTENTIVGGPHIRGISGGERKRVSIAELMISSACVCCFDGPTRGLDASTALDYCKSIRILTNVYKMTTFVSLYQASENIYSLFDKVLVIDAGHQVFFGPATEARAYFESIGFKEKPRQTTPDYLTGCTDAFEREYSLGRSAQNVPHSPESLARAFRESKYWTRLENEMNEYSGGMESRRQKYDEFKLAHLEAKHRHAGKSSVYTVPLYLQTWALIRRQARRKFQDKLQLFVSYGTSLVVAILLGTVWLDQPQTSAGAFTRGGLLFISIVFNGFQAFGDLPSSILGRSIISKHRALTFHRPSALWLGQVFVDMAFAIVQITIFSLIVYFLCGLTREPGAFFVFVLTVITAYIVMTLFFRTLGSLSPNLDVALRAAVLVLTLLITTSGYLIQYDKEQVWLRWLFYFDGFGLGFSALMINEFSRINMTCTDESIIPSGPTYHDPAHQVCTLAGSETGTYLIPGKAYLASTFSFLPEDLWRNWGIMIVIIAFFLCLNVYLGEVLKWAASGRTVTFFVKENTERKNLNTELRQRKQGRLEKKELHGSDLSVASRAVLTWEELNYDVPVPGGIKRLLSDVYGYVEPGTLTAMVGASGAGKTTLLDVLAARKNIGVITGQILVDGKVPGTSFQRATSYAEQLDMLWSTQTVREAFRVSADLRQPFETLTCEKYAYVEEIISLLEMEDIADAIIGDPEWGLTVEQRKRTTIGIELCAKPELLLFLDEPTSGLDSQSAFNIVRFLKKLAAAGQCILCTIHQPNAALFESFDRLLLLQKGGECVYFGDIGENAQTVIDYFHRNGADCPPRANPAEWMLDAIGAGITPRIGDRDWGEIWRESPEFTKTVNKIAELKHKRLNHVSAEPIKSQKEYATPLWHQIKVVNTRAFKDLWRSPDYTFTRIFNQFSLALVTGLVFLRLDDSRTSLQSRVFVAFQVTVLPALILAQVEPKYDMVRRLFYRENAAKSYSALPFALSTVLAEVPYVILSAVVFFVPLYFLPGLQTAPDRAGYQFLMVLIVEFFCTTLGLVIAALTPGTHIAVLLNPPIQISLFMFCGVTIPAPQMPGFWRAWLYQLDPFTRLISGMVVTELAGRSVVCQPNEFNRFSPPPGQTCGEYMAAFFASGEPGYLADANSTSVCEYCAYATGEQFYQPLGLAFENRWRDLGIMAAFVGSNLMILLLAARYINFNRR